MSSEDTIPVPVTILGGFLGSGKTSLLNRALRNPGGRRIAVVVNELGEIGLDGALVEGGESFVELDNGCLCCALNEDLVTTLGEIGEVEGLDHVMIETTGIADPLPIGHAVTRAELGARFRLDALVTAVDCLNLERAMETAEEPDLQIRRADMCVLTKTDIADADQVSRIEARVAELAPQARVIRSDHEGLIELLLDAKLEGGSSASRQTIEETERHRHHGFSTLSVDVGDRGTIRLAFEDFLEFLPPEIYRAKGIVKIEGEPGRLIFHVVGGRVDYWHEPGRGGPGQLVFIGKKFDKDSLREEVESLFEVIS